MTAYTALAQHHAVKIGQEQQYNQNTIYLNNLDLQLKTVGPRLRFHLRILVGLLTANVTQLTVMNIQNDHHACCVRRKGRHSYYILERSIQGPYFGKTLLISGANLVRSFYQGWR